MELRYLPGYKLMMRRSIYELKNIATNYKLPTDKKSKQTIAEQLTILDFERSVRQYLSISNGG